MTTTHRCQVPGCRHRVSTTDELDDEPREPLCAFHIERRALLARRAERRRQARIERAEKVNE